LLLSCCQRLSEKEIRKDGARLRQEKERTAAPDGRLSWRSLKGKAQWRRTNRERDANCVTMAMQRLPFLVMPFNEGPGCFNETRIRRRKHGNQIGLIGVFD
jgi:hypothetical protein